MAVNRVFFLVFRFLHPSDLVQNVSLVSKSMRSQVNNNELWAELIMDTFGVEEGLPGIVESRMAEFRWRTMTQSLVQVSFKHSSSTLVLTRVPSMRTRTLAVSDLPMFGSLCWLWTGELFLTGGSEQREYFSSTFRINVSTARSRKTADMTDGRIDHGVVVQYPFVYVFGGYNGSTIASSEKLDLRGEAWTQLPSMQVPRRFFTPCYLKASVYMAGGGDMRIERFCTVQEQFFFCGVSLNTTYTSVMAIGYSTKVVFVNYECVTEFELGKDGGDLKASRLGHVKVLDWHSTTGTVFYDGKAYFLLKAHNATISLDLSKLQVLSETLSSKLTSQF